MFRTVSLSPRIKNDNIAVKMGMKLVKTFALANPMFLTEKEKRINAPHEAKKASSITGMNELKVMVVSLR